MNKSRIYENFSKTGSRGVELEYKVAAKKVTISANYSFYTTAGKNEVALYEIRLNKNALLSFPQHKIALLSGVNITKNFSINPSAVFYTKRFAVQSIDALGNPIESELAPALLLNLSLSCRNIVKGLDISLACFDLLNERYSFAQAFKSTLATIPGAGREVMARIVYTLSKK